MKLKHHPANRVGSQVYCWDHDTGLDFAVTMNSYDNTKLATATRMDTGVIISRPASYFFRRLINDANVHRALSRPELFVLGGGVKREFRPRARFSTWHVPGRDEHVLHVKSKHEALQRAKTFAAEKNCDVEIALSVQQDSTWSCCHTVVTVTASGHAAQYFGSVRGVRGRRPKFLRGYGKLNYGRPCGGSMRKRRYA